MNSSMHPCAEILCQSFTRSAEEPGIKRPRTIVAGERLAAESGEAVDHEGPRNSECPL